MKGVVKVVDISCGFVLASSLLSSFVLFRLQDTELITQRITKCNTHHHRDLLDPPRLQREVRGSCRRG
jgi:hypothetical protein